MVVTVCDVCGKTSKELTVYDDVTLSVDELGDFTQDVCEQCLSITLRSLGRFEAPSCREVVIEPDLQKEY